MDLLEISLSDSDRKILTSCCSNKYQTIDDVSDNLDFVHTLKKIIIKMMDEHYISLGLSLQEGVISSFGISHAELLTQRRGFLTNTEHETFLEKDLDSLDIPTHKLYFRKFLRRDSFTAKSCDPQTYIRFILHIGDRENYTISTFIDGSDKKFNLEIDDGQFLITSPGDKVEVSSNPVRMLMNPTCPDTKVPKLRNPKYERFNFVIDLIDDSIPI